MEKQKKKLIILILIDANITEIMFKDKGKKKFYPPFFRYKITHSHQNHQNEIKYVKLIYFFALHAKGKKLSYL